MTNIFLDGFHVFQNYVWSILYILIIMVWGQRVMQITLSKIIENQLEVTEMFSVSLIGWVIPVLSWAVLYFCATLVFGEIAGIISSTILLFIPFFLNKFKKPSIIVISLSILLLISIFLRLAFLSKAIFPAYFDSPKHFANIQHLLSLGKSNTFSVFQENYYHLGYHLLSASFLKLAQIKIIDFTLIFGQITLAVLPISFFFLTRKMTSSNTVAFLTCLVAGFGFHMPAHLLNWGKYPALLSLFGIQFVLCLAIIKYTTNLNSTQGLKLNFIILFSIGLTVLIHSRTVVVFLILTMLFLVNSQIAKRGIQKSFFVFVIIILAIQIYIIQNNSALFPLTERYLQQDSWILIGILLLIPFSFKKYTNQVMFLFSFISLLAFTLFIPISLPNYGIQTILDRPFVQLILYIPLTLLAGLGFASLMQLFSQSKHLISIILFLGITTNIYFKYDFYPSPCCQLISQDDLTAFEWIKDNTSPKARILISTTQLHVTSFEDSVLKAPVDGGVWLFLLTSRENPAGFFGANFQSIETHTEICSRYIDYIYVGSMPQSFNQNQLASHPNWYQPVFLSPKAQVYQVIGCD